MRVDDAFHGITTLVRVTTPEGSAQATGFYYQRLAAADPTKDAQWRQVEKTWLVTNRHVALPKIRGTETPPSTFAFHLRRADGAELRWDPIIVDGDGFLKRARFHPDPSVDVCVIEVLDLLTAKIKDGTAKYQAWFAVHADQFPGKNNIAVEVADEAIVIGYPRGFYDHVHLFPIVKAGIIASRWGAPFQGRPYFLIDAKLFPGSSGSIVVSKPQSLAIVDGRIMYAAERQFAFLGIYSGEPFLQDTPLEFEDMTIIRRSGFNLGIVWYANLVDEIIESGVSFATGSG